MSTTATPWEPVIGLEIHAQLATRSKIFSGASTAYGAEPNTQACVVDLGFPGVLPVLNAQAVRMAVMFGLAINACIARRSVFARKNYFYPDLPKGYQISQYELPIVHQGAVLIDLSDGTQKRVGVTRAHLEEDAGKSLHEDFQGMTGIDLNRAGTPLLEIVSEPDLRSPAEAIAYMKKVHAVVRYLGICDGNMQEGSFRCDANVSVRRRGVSRLGTRTEIKNLNSFRFVERALGFEIERQTALLEDGETVRQETRLYDADQHRTRSMRGKEDAHDYRYFPDPDLPPVVLSAEFIECTGASLPELPDAKRQRFIDDHGLSAYDAGVLTAARETADFFESVVCAAGGEARLAANWVTGELAAALNRESIDISSSPVTACMLGLMIKRIADGTISGKIAKTVFEAMWAGERDPDQIIEVRGLQQVTDNAVIESLVDAVIEQHPDQAAQFRDGQVKVLGFLVGRVMKASRGKANPQQVNDILRQKLTPCD